MFIYCDTILGKLLAIIIIIYSTYENIIYGLFTCILIIWFYQSDLLERCKPKYKYNEYFTPSTPQTVYVPNEPNKDVQSISTLMNDLSLDKVYPDELAPMKKEAEQVFRNQHCSKELDIMYKNSKIIHKEDVKNMFPEVSFLDDIPCNPCDSGCKFRITKINKETELMSKQARGNESSIWDWAKEWNILKTEPYEGIGQVASYLP